MFSYETDIPDVIRFVTTSSGRVSLPISSVFYEGDAGDDTVNIEFPVAEYVYDGTNDLVSELLVTTTNDSYSSFNLSLDVGELKLPDYISTAINIWKQPTNPEYEELPSLFFVQGFMNYGNNDVNYSFRVNIGTILTDTDIHNEVSLAAAVYFGIVSNVFCATSGTTNIVNCDIKQNPGRISVILDDIYSSNIKKVFLKKDLYVSDINNNYIDSDIEVSPGKRTYIRSDLYNAKLKYGHSISSDIKTRSLFVGGFFIEPDEFIEASSIGSIDLIDYLYGINESSIYIQKDGTTLSGISIEDIPNGKRVFFDPDDDYYSDGEIVLRVYAESLIGEVLDQEFYLLYGYNLELNEVVGWKPNSRVYIRSTASNKAFCKNYEGIAYYFDTVDYDSFDLGASISAAFNLSSDINFSIYPQSTAFFYGKTYTVTVSGVKDHSGNVMAPFVYSFTIESPQ
jgi:hypothetical protein